MLVAALLSFSPIIRAWWQSVKHRPKPAIFLIVALAGTLIGTGEKADIAAIQSGLPDAYRIVRVLLAISLFSIASMGIIKDLSSFRLAGSGARWMVVYAFIAMASAIYSVDGFVSLWKGFEVMTLVLVVISVASQLRTAEDLNWLFNVTSLMLFYIVLTLYVGLALYPGDAIKDQEYLGVRGLMPPLNPSSVGSISSLLVVSTVGSLLYRWPSKKKTAGIWFVLLAAIGTLILAHSRTPIFAGAIAIIVMLIAGRHYRFAIVTTVVGTSLVAAISMDEILEYIYRGQTHESLVGMTGRVGVWETMWPTVAESPIVGHGYYAAQRILFGLSTVDNSYLEVLLGLGLFGLSIFLIPVLLSVKALISTRPRSKTPVVNKLLWAQAMGVFLIIVIRGFTAPSFQVQHPLLVFYMLSLIGIAALLRLKNEKQPTQAVADTLEVTEDPTLFRKKKSRILSARRR